MSTVVYPPGISWTPPFTAEEVTNMRADPATARMMDLAEQYAWMALASLTADRIGMAPIMVRPCAQSWRPNGTWTEAPVDGWPRLLAGHAYVSPLAGPSGAWWGGCGCADACGCTALSEVILPGPVGQIVEVWIDGVVQSPTSYRVDNGNRLISLVADRPWPARQDLMAAYNEPGAFAVRYYQGSAPNDAIIHAASLLAVQLYYSFTNDRRCQLPRNATQVTRNGLSFEVDVDFVSTGRTGIEAVDLLVSRLNPFRKKVPTVIYSPDVAVPRRTTLERF